MIEATRLSHLSAARQVLVRVCQSLDYGQISGLHVIAGEPVYCPAPVLVREIKLDGECGRAETNLADFTLRDELRRLFGHLERFGTGRIEKIEVRAGLPRRVIVEQLLGEALL